MSFLALQRSASKNRLILPSRVPIFSLYSTKVERPIKATPQELECLKVIEKRLIWTATYLIHNANLLRPKTDGLKVGGHQASSSSVASILTALYFKAMQPWDRIAVKPHASPIMHAAQYLLGRQSLSNLQNFRSLGGAQSYPSRTKDQCDVDFSTGSVGLGATVTSFAALAQEYLTLKGLKPKNIPEGGRPGRMIALLGDAELDEGNVFEGLLESWRYNIPNNFLIIDYNRQSLDRFVSNRFVRQVERMFRGNGFEVLTLKYGKLQMAAFARPGGAGLRKWLDECSNEVYSVLTYKGGAAFRDQILRDVNDAATRDLVNSYDDASLYSLMTNLAGHCIETLLEAFDFASKGDQSTCFIIYTIKGYGLSTAGHRDNHGGLLNDAQVALLQRDLSVPLGSEWSPLSGLAPDVLHKVQTFIGESPLYQHPPRRFEDDRIPVPADLIYKKSDTMSTQEAFGRIMLELGRSAGRLGDRIVTSAPDVATSTQLGGWVNSRGVFGRKTEEDALKTNKVASMQKWEVGPQGQHVELGIAENNLFLQLAAFGLTNSIFGVRLLPVGTLYDPFISRGLDALNYGCYMDSRFMLVATPSGVTLAPEGGAHQSIYTPLIGIGQPNLAYFEPDYADTLSVIMSWGFNYMQEPKGSSVYLRLSTRPLAQPKREMTESLRNDIVQGAYWVAKPGSKTKVCIVYLGALAPEASEAKTKLEAELGADSVCVLAVTSPWALHKGWVSRSTGKDSTSHVDKILEKLDVKVPIVSVCDATGLSLSWLGSVRGHRVSPLGVHSFGQSGTIKDLYKIFGLDADSIATTALKTIHELNN